MSEPDQTATDNSVIEQITALSAQFEKIAEDTDQGGPLNQNLRDNIMLLGEMGFYGSGISKAYGGLAISGAANKECLQLLASACGVTAFTQQQLHAGGGFLGHNSDEDLKAELLPQFCSGKNLCGVGFSHLRRPGPPSVAATKTSYGFEINGVVPWITAWPILNSFILGATVDDGTMIFNYLPIAEFADCLTPSASMKLSVMNAADTVELRIEKVKLPSRYVLFHHPADHMVRSDFNGITGHMDPPLGCARGSAAYLRSLGERRKRPQYAKIADKIEQEVSHLNELSQTWNGSRSADPEYKENALKTRTGAISLAIRSAAAGVAASSGSAHLASSPAQRRYREAAFYSTAAQTSDIQYALVERFINDQFD